VLLDLEAGLISTGGRSKVMDAEAFPWLPVPFEDCFKNVTADNFDITKGTKALYFSAHWCGPCRNFTPNLKKVYETLKADGKDFEVVFVTSDRTQEQFNEYFAEMPWAAIPFDNKSEIASLEEKFEVSGIPAMAVLQDGKLINPSAVSSVRAAGGDNFDVTAAAAAFPWKKEAVQELTMSTASGLNDFPCLILFQDGLDADVQKANAAFLQNAAAAELETELSGEKRKMAYFTHNQEHENITKVLQGMMTEVSENHMIILHFGGQGAYYVGPLPQSEDDVTKFVADFHAGNLERKQANPPGR
jgi:nucleoredoxin